MNRDEAILATTDLIFTCRGQARATGIRGRRMEDVMTASHLVGFLEAAGFTRDEFAALWQVVTDSNPGAGA